MIYNITKVFCWGDLEVKHQALARVFAVVLAVMCLLMGINGLKGFGKAQDEYRERTDYADRYAKRINTYIEIDEELKGSITYDEALKELEKMQEEHDKDASQHKTDTAMYSAEKGGNTMGADMIWELMPQLKGARAELEAGKKQLEEGEAQLQQAKAAIDGLIISANNGASQCSNAVGELNIFLGNLSALMAQEPAPPEKPVEPTAPTEPAAPAELSEDADEVAKAEYEAAMAEYNEKLVQYEAEKAAYDAAMLEYNSAVEKYNAEQAEYEAAHSEWQNSYTELMASPVPANSAETLANQASAFVALANAVEEATGQALPFDPSGMSELNPTSPEELRNALDMLAGGYSAISGGLVAAGPVIALKEQELAAAKAQLEAGEKELEKGEAEAQRQLELIWYNLGELEKDKAELEESKIKLDEEANVLSKKVVETDELKALENKRTSTRLILTGVKEVKDMYEESKDLVGSANTYLDSYRTETDKLHVGKLILNGLAVLGAVSGFIGIPAAFEKIKKRFWLIAPVVLCLICACAADGINMYLGLGQMYTALAAAIFAAIHLLVILPKQHVVSD